MPSCISKPSAVVRFGMAMMPALLMSRSRPWGLAVDQLWANARTELRSARSRVARSTLAAGVVARILSAATWPFTRSRTAMVTFAPLAASASVVQNPRPELAPVTMTVWPVRSGKSERFHLAFWADCMLPVLPIRVNAAVWVPFSFFGASLVRLRGFVPQ